MVAVKYVVHPAAECEVTPMFCSQPCQEHAQQLALQTVLKLAGQMMLVCGWTAPWYAQPLVPRDGHLPPQQW